MSLLFQPKPMGFRRLQPGPGESGAAKRTRSFACRPIIVLLALAGLVSLQAAAESPESPVAEVIVLGTLHQVHNDIAFYGFGDLERIIERLQPDVLCVELQPTDLESRPEERTKQEYPRVVYRSIDKHHYRVYAMEPAEPLYSQLLGPYVDANRRFAEEDARRYAILERFMEGTYDVLKAYWASPADINSELTDRVFRAKHDLQGALAGPGEVAGWEAWNQHFLDVIETAARESPGKRVLVLVGLDHTYWLRDRLRSSKGLQLVDTAKRLEDIN